MRAWRCQSPINMARLPRLFQGGSILSHLRKAPWLTTHSTPSAPRRARSSSSPLRASPQQHQRRPHVGVRQASIGIRRMPSSNALRQVSQQPNPSGQRLSTPLPALDEEHALGQIDSNSSKPVSSKVEPSRLRKVKSAIQTRIPFWGTPEKHTTPDTNGAAGGAPQYHESADYTSDMVDVLDTLGMLTKHAGTTA